MVLETPFWGVTIGIVVVLVGLPALGGLVRGEWRRGGARPERPSDALGGAPRVS